MSYCLYDVPYLLYRYIIYYYVFITALANNMSELKSTQNSIIEMETKLKDKQRTLDFVQLSHTNELDSQRDNVFRKISMIETANSELLEQVGNEIDLLKSQLGILKSENVVLTRKKDSFTKEREIETTKIKDQWYQIHMQTQELKNSKKKNDEELNNVKDSIMSSLEKDKGSFKNRLNHIDFREQELASKVSSNSNPMADLFSSISTPITSAYTSKFYQAQYKSIEAVQPQKETSKDIAIEPNASTVLSRETSTSTPLFYINEPTLGTGGAIGTEIEKEIKKKQKNRVSFDQLVDSNIICSKDDVTKSYNSSTRYDEEQYIKNVPTKISNKNIGNVHRQYDHKLQNEKNKNKKEQFHRKKKEPLTYTNLPVLETITTNYQVEKDRIIFQNRLTINCKNI